MPQNTQEQIDAFNRAKARAMLANAKKRNASIAKAQSKAAPPSKGEGRSMLEKLMSKIHPLGAARKKIIDKVEE